MKIQKAVHLAIESMRKEIQTVAFSANLQKQFHLTSPTAVNAARKYDELTEAIELLEKMNLKSA